MKKILSCFFILLLFTVFQAFGDTIYYVDSSGGDDQNSGRSSASAWKTLSKVSERTFSPGDIILLKRGETWRESLIINSSGNINKSIVYGAYGNGPKPVINGARVVEDWSWVEGSIYRKSFDRECTVVIEDNRLLTQLKWEGSLSSTFDEASPGCFSVRLTDNRLFVWCSDSADPDTHKMEIADEPNWPNYAGICIRDASYIVVQDLEVRYAARYGIRIDCSEGNDESNCVIQNCNVHKNGGYGIIISNGLNMNGNHPITDCVIRANTVFENRLHGIHFKFHVADSTILRNVVYNNGWNREAGFHGISTWSNSNIAKPTENVIENNEVFGTYAVDGQEGNGIQCDDKTDSTVVRYNKCYKNVGSGIMIHKSSNCKVYYNLSFDNGLDNDYNRAGIYCLNSTDTKIYNNVFYKNAQNGILVGGEDDSSTRIRNNILSKNSVYEIRVFPDGGEDYKGNYNCFHHPDGGSFLRWGTSSYNFDSWKSATGYDGRSINRSPQFVWDSENSFALESTSACIDAGTDVGLIEDFLGHSVPFGDGVDIGAYEFRREHLLGTWQNSGVFYLDSKSNTWYYLGSPADAVAVGDINGNQIDDLLGVWDDGVWVRYSESGEWAKLTSDIPYDIASGDMDSDGRDDLLGTWTSGVFYRSSVDGQWVMIASPAELVASGDLDGDGINDLVGVWQNQGGVWVKYSSTGDWEWLASTARNINIGDMTGDGREDLLGTWDGQGVFYRDSANGQWVMMASPAELVASGDLDGDEKNDLVGVWPNQSGIWVKYSSTGDWKWLANGAEDIDAGKMSGGTESINMMDLKSSTTKIDTGPDFGAYYEDFSDQGPLGWNFIFKVKKNLIPNLDNSDLLMRIPGPGQAGFVYSEQENIIPAERYN